MIAPKVSIIVPIFNAEMYLAECLSSLCNQTLKDIEIICINDGSTDNSVAIIKKVCAQDSRVKLINQQNLGPCETRKNGIIQASGEYIGFVDSDDYVDSRFFELLYTAACREQADIAVTTEIFPFDDRRIFPKKNSGFSKSKKSLTACERAKLFLRTAVPWDKIYKNELCLHVLPYYMAEEKWGEDNMFSIPSLIMAKKVTLITDAIYFYRQHASSICHTPVKTKNILNLYNSYNMMLRKVCELHINKNDITIYKKAIIRRRNFYCFQLSEQLTSISERISFALQTKDIQFQIAYLARKSYNIFKNIIKK